MKTLIVFFVAVILKYIKKNFDITNPPLNDQIWPVPSDFLKFEVPLYLDYKFY